jgi:hypothetical protein
MNWCTLLSIVGNARIKASNASMLEDRLGDQRWESEWESIKILPEG